MQHSIDKIQFLTGSRDMLLNISNVPARPTWNEYAVSFLGTLSRNLLRNITVRNFPDVTSYAFWIRNASLRQIREHCYSNVESKIGRGTAFHIAPSNVPVNFAVSFTSSLLAGNANIVRVSNKHFEQVALITEALKETFSEGFADMEQYIIIIRYEHDEKITQFLSSMCDIRIIWGGNRTIELVRSAALPPRAIEMAFADRHSIAILNSEAVAEADIDKLASDFYTDTYYIDQNACSSPRIVIWLGSRIQEAKVKFWTEVEKLVRAKYDFREIQAVDKLDAFCKLAAANKNVTLESKSNTVMRINVSKLDSDIMNYKFGGGFFFEFEAQKLSDIAPILNKPCQTLAYFGLDGQEIQRFIIDGGYRGVDRVVPIGKTMDLTFKWDGFDMIETMSRYVDYKI